MKINFKYLIPIMVLACLNIALLNDFFSSEDFSNNKISNGLFYIEQLAEINDDPTISIDSNKRDSLIDKEIKIN